jgi:X-Pro dipeptidyl-peptidase
MRPFLVAIATSAALLLANGLALADTPPLGVDGATAPVYDIDQVRVQRVYIALSNVDQDANGFPDRVAFEIIRPRESGPGLKIPAIIDPSPYLSTICRGNESECIKDTDGDGLNDKWPMFYENYFVPRGYAFIWAESNGTANSNGCPLHGGPGDVAGMKSVVDWLNGRVAGFTADGTPVTADWHNGSSAMIGKSYDGTLTNGVAATGVEGLKTIVPQSAISDWYLYSRMGGINRTGFSSNYPSSLSNAVTNPDRQAGCQASRDQLAAADGDENGDRNGFWDARDYLPNVGNVRASVFATHGLQDDNVTTDQFATWWAGLAAANVPRKLWLLREGHVDPFDSRRAAWVDSLHRWFDYWLYGVQNGIMNQPRVDIEDSKDVWNTYADWPLPATGDMDVYLRAATPATGAGVLGLSSGGDADALTFNDSSTQSETTMLTTPTGSQTSRRVFLSPPLTQPLRISGTPRVDLQASVSTTQSNLGVALVDYGAGSHITRNADGISNDTTSTCWGQNSSRMIAGVPVDYDNCYREVTKPTVSATAWRVARGVLDSSNRDSLTTPALLTADTTTRFRWPLYPTDYVFPAGHQIGVILVGDYRDVAVASGNSSVRITLDAKRSKVVLPIVGGYAAARASGAFPDTVAPALTVASDIVAEDDGGGGAVVTYPAPGVTDDEDPSPTASCTPASGTRFGTGTTTVTCTGRDDSGNVTQKTFTVTVSPKPVTTTPPQDPIVDPPAPPVDSGGETTPPPPAPPSSTPPPPAPKPPPALDTRDRLAPALGSVKLSAKRGSAKLTFKLSETATVTATITRRGSKKSLKTVKVTLAKGSRSIVLKSSKLGKGRYTLTLRAVDPARNARSLTRSLTIKR